jgi:glycerophosphoryl diester phosphodiesterase
MRLLAALLLLSPLMMDAAPKKILVHGHRGARARMPENTLPAFQHAIDVGADVLELDLAVTKDNVLVVSHDPELHAPICTGPREKAVIRELTLAEVKQWDCGAMQNPRYPKQQTVPGTRMPTLDEVLALGAKTNVEFNIETKIFRNRPEVTPAPEEFARLLVEAIRRHRLEQRAIIQSFDYRTLVAARKLAPEIRLSALKEGTYRPYSELAKEAANAEIVSPLYPLVTKERVEEAHRAGLQVVPWTANEPKDWDRLVAAGVDAIITDDPAALIAHLKAKGLR